jgi:uncharacterized membrane protein
VNPVPRWAVGASFALSLIGLGISTYLTITHFGGTGLLVCSGTGVVNCALVTTSAQSYFLGIPVAILGLAQYTAMSIINSPWGWRAPWRWLAIARLALGVVGMGMVLWLFSAELLIIGHICLWCSGVHVVTLILLIVLTRVSPAQLGWTTKPSAEASAVPLH